MSTRVRDGEVVACGPVRLLAGVREDVLTRVRDGNVLCMSCIAGACGAACDVGLCCTGAVQPGPVLVGAAVFKHGLGRGEC